MKILFCIPSLEKGGAQRVISVLCDKLIKNNEICIAVNIKDKIAYKFDNSVKIIQMDEKKYKNPLKRNLKRIKSLKQILRLEKPDIIISFLPMPSFLSLFANRKTKIPIIVADRNDPKKEYKGKISNFLMKWLYPKANGFVFQTSEQQQYFEDIIQEKSTIIFNPIKEEFLDLQDIDNNKKENVIITAGRLVNQKNQKLLINAFYEVLQKHPDYKLKIFGEGNLKQELQNQINSLKIEKNVFLCGLTDNMKKELEKAKIFVLPSDYEGMPNVLIEAMAIGLPSISTDCPCGGPKELIINNKNGILIPVNDKEELINKINYLIENNQIAIQIGNNAKNIKEKLNPDNIVGQWEKYIKYVLEEANKEKNNV